MLERRQRRLNMGGRVQAFQTASSTILGRNYLWDLWEHLALLYFSWISIYTLDAARTIIYTTSEMKRRVETPFVATTRVFITYTQICYQTFCRNLSDDVSYVIIGFASISNDIVANTASNIHVEGREIGGVNPSNFCQPQPLAAWSSREACMIITHLPENHSHHEGRLAIN